MRASCPKGFPSTCSWSAAGPPGSRPPSPPSAPARAWRSRRRASLQSCNSAKAQGGIQAAFGEDDSPEQHAEDVWQSSHETADRGLVEVLTGEAPAAIHWLEELGVEFTRENGGYRLARCGGATRKRLLQVGDRTGHAITTALRDAFEASSGDGLPEQPARRARASRERLARDVSRERRRARDRRRRGRARRRRPLLPRGRGARRALDEPPGRDRRGDADRARPRRRGARPRRAPVPPERRRVAADDAGLLDPRDDARVRRRRCSTPTARSSPTRSARATRSRRRSSTRSRRAAASRRPTAAPPCSSTRRAFREADAEISLPYMLRRYRAAGIDPLARADPHLPRAPLPERRPRDRRATPRRRSKGSTPAARSPAARTGATG